jgi:hypothetical protein
LFNKIQQGKKYIESNVQDLGNADPVLLPTQVKAKFQDIEKKTEVPALLLNTVKDDSFAYCHLSLSSRLKQNSQGDPKL